jgi:hypothetical protein
MCSAAEEAIAAGSSSTRARITAGGGVICGIVATGPRSGGIDSNTSQKHGKKGGIVRHGWGVPPPRHFSRRPAKSARPLADSKSLGLTLAS